jgi:hypothetical protein
MPEIDLNDLAGGALSELIAMELQKVATNIADPNTKASAVRSIAINISLKPDEQREIAQSEINVKSKLAPVQGIPTRFIIGRDAGGRVQAAELKSGSKNQTYFDNDGKIRDHVGNELPQDQPAAADNVVDIKKPNFR